MIAKNSDLACECSSIGSDTTALGACTDSIGQCTCSSGYIGTKCDTCDVNYYLTAGNICMSKFRIFFS